MVKNLSFDKIGQNVCLTFVIGVDMTLGSENGKHFHHFLHETFVSLVKWAIVKEHERFNFELELNCIIRSMKRKTSMAEDLKKFIIKFNSQ